MQKLPSPPKLPKPEIWGGVECSFTRVNNIYTDQLKKSGHYTREEDLEKILMSGIQTLRYPVLWEKIAFQSLDKPDWKWSDKQLSFLQKAGIRVIAGLLHHGCGPAYATYQEDNFVLQFTKYAEMVANRYPWLTYYTPINEPLTTARFSGLYGIWFPHERNDLTFCKIFLSQCKATVLAMQAIRKVQPNAQLVQTEDLGEIHSVPELAYQAEFENNRKWLTFDILCGKVDESHPLWYYFSWAGICKEELCFFLDNPCPPDIIGINYYPTSERFLDTAIENYPFQMHGGNNREVYVDTEAARVSHVTLRGIESLICQTWERYHIPVAVTETHLGCTREEQMRWLFKTYQAALSLHKKDIPVKAVTVWAMLGSFDWNTLLTEENNYYEAGMFDIRSGEIRPTALFYLTKKLLAGESSLPSVVYEKGWWEKGSIQTVPRLLLLNKELPLGKVFEHNLSLRGITYITFSDSETCSNLDKTCFQEMQKSVEDNIIWAVIDCKVREAKISASIVSSVLDEDCKKKKIPVLFFSESATNFHNHPELTLNLQIDIGDLKITQNRNTDLINAKKLNQLSVSLTPSELSFIQNLTEDSLDFLLDNL